MTGGKQSSPPTRVVAGRGWSSGVGCDFHDEVGVEGCADSFQQGDGGHDAARLRRCHAGSVIPLAPLTSGQPDVKGGAMTTPASLERQHTLATAVARYDELRMRDLLAPGAEDLPADEQPEPWPLSQQEALEMLALSEVIARKAAYGRQLTVRSARAAGASWTQIGAALGTTKQSAWEAHSRWIDQQANQRGAYGHQSMDSQQAAAARALAGNPDSEAPA